MIRPSYWLTVIGVAALAGNMLAADVASTQTASGPKYLAPDEVDIMKLLPPPPAQDSAETKAEIDLLARIHDSRTPEELDRAKAEKKLTMAAFTSVVGPWFTAENLPRLNKMFVEIDAETKAYTDGGKDAFARVRPPKAEAKDKSAESQSSYPSGHSTRGTIYAMVLTQLFPELKAQLLTRSQEIGWDRIILGVHYPSDVVAGRVLGMELGRHVLANSAFQAELVQVRAEVAAARQAALVAAHH